MSTVKLPWDERRPSSSMRLFPDDLNVADADYDWTWIDQGFMFGGQFENYINVTNQHIVTYQLVPTRTATMRFMSALATDIWPAFTWSRWRELCQQHQVPISSLQHIAFIYNHSGDPDDIARDIQFFHPDYIPRLNSNANGSDQPLHRFTPPDDNLFALLGTMPATAVGDLLVLHQKSLATRNEQTGAVEKVKSIRDIQVVQSGGQRKASFRPYNLYITLQDFDPSEVVTELSN